MSEQKRPRLLDLFCGAGGSAVGYHRAGFEVVGVDIEPQPNYPFKFVRADALAVLGGRQAPITYAADWDAIHASPPCQAYTHARHIANRGRNDHPRLIEPTREFLIETSLPYVIENVPNAIRRLHGPIQLCGRALGLPIHRHRLFETNFSLMSPGCTGGRDPFGIYGKLDGRRLWTRPDGSVYRAAKTLEEAQRAMGMGWSNWDGLREAIPPVMTEHIGFYLLNHLRTRERTAA